MVRDGRSGTGQQDAAPNLTRPGTDGPGPGYGVRAASGAGGFRSGVNLL
jgi:hypothetical protein